MSLMNKIPELDLRTLDEGTYKEAMKEFRLKHCETHKNVIVIDKDGRQHLVPTAPPTLKIGTPAPDDAMITVVDPSDVVGTFLDLTTYTVPYGNELLMYDQTLQDYGFIRNGRGNYWKTVGDGTSKTLFVAHLDTADRGKPMVVNHVFTEDNYVKTDLTTYLGADDRAGMAVMFYLMAQNVPGDYLFVIGEEMGCIGSSDEAKDIEQGRYDRAIQFDRAGTGEVITHQMGIRTASREFARALCKEFKRTSNGVIQLQPSDRGVYTDTKEFTHLIPECTNIAVGYVRQHSVQETQDLSFLVTLANAAAKINWECLPTSNPMQVFDHHVYDIDAAEYDQEAPFVSLDTYEQAKKNMWEMWAEVDSGEWSIDEMRRWVTFNPETAAKIIMEHIKSEPKSSLDTLTAIGGY